MQNRLFSRRLVAVLLAALMLALPACSAAPDVTYGGEMPTLSEDELPSPEQMLPPDDVSAYPTLANNVFSDVPTAPASDFTYTESNGTLTLTSYSGAGGVVILPDAIDGLAVTALGDALFKDQTSLTAISIPDSVTTIGAELLNGCRSLQVIRTPQMAQNRQDEDYLAYLFGGTSPQLGAFKIGAALDTVILTDGVTTVDPLAFYGAYRLIMVILPDTLTSVEEYAFWGCTALKYAALPEGVTTIGEGAFADCTALQSMYIPSSVRSIGANALMNCSSLRTLSLPFTGESRTGSVTHVGYLFGAEAYIWNASFLPSSLRQITLREGNVANYAFYACDHLYRIELPSDCTSIGVRAFQGCTSLLSVTLPDTVTHVGDMAFSDCRWLSTVTLSQGLLDIGMQTFMGCINLTEIALPDTLTMLPPSLFSGCKRLQKVTLGSGLTTVDDHVFHHCISLSEVSCADGSAPTHLSIGKGNTALTDCLPSSDSAGKE